MTSSRRKSSALVIPHQPTRWRRLGATLMCTIIRYTAATLRFRWTDRSGHFQVQPASPAIYCLWHNRLALCMAIYHGYIKPRSETSGLAALISASRYGGFLAAILDNFQVQVVRGSSSRRGPQALRELTTCSRLGYSIAITPYGPRGPRHVVQEGVVSLAQLTGLPIIPVSTAIKCKICTNTWDRFQIPFPFSRCEVILEKPIYVPREISPEERESYRARLERVLNSISEV